MSGQELDGIELVLFQDLLPQFVKTNRILQLFSSSSSKTSHQSLSAAFQNAVHDEGDVSRIHAVPKTFGCLLVILIQPHLSLQRLIHPYATLFQLPAVFSVGIYIKPSPTPTGCLRGRVRGRQVASVMEAQETWDEEVITPRWQSKPPHTTGAHKTKEGVFSKSQQAVLDNWILSRTDYQVVSDHSDFAKVAVWRTRKSGRSIVVREQERAQDHEPGFVDILDCGALLRNIGFDE
ncbi:hypothetical protein BGZ81_008553 [Podila clonocystis]|nr:hypothetical protein BGZ81_008553 [Podila clonocystis]